MKTTKDKLTKRVLENLKAIQRKKEIQATIEEILADSDSEILEEKSKRGRRQKKRARQQAKKEKAKAAKAADTKKETEAQKRGRLAGEAAAKSLTKRAESAIAERNVAYQKPFKRKGVELPFIKITG